jgi:selenocysteine lyase/cysteine desulfurase
MSGPPGMDPELEAFRSRVPLLATTVYLANCSQGPLSDPVREAMERFLAGWAERGMDWDEWIGEVEAARSAFAALIGAESRDVAVGASMSQLVSSVVSAYVRERRAPRRRILSSLAEFPGVAHAWLAARAYGWHVDQLAADAVASLDSLDVMTSIDEDTAIVSVPHVSYANGSMIDLPMVVEAAHARGAKVFVDAYQSAGTMPIDVRDWGVDFLASGALKYLMGAAGIAFLYVSPEAREGLEPTITGWFGRVDPYAFDSSLLDYADGSSRFDLGTPPIATAYAARAGIDLVRETGPDRIRRRIERLSEVALNAADQHGLRILGTRDPSAKGATTAVDAGTEAAAGLAAEGLLTRGIVTSPRGRALRLAPHGFTRDDEIEHAMATAAAILRP